MLRAVYIQARVCTNTCLHKHLYVQPRLCKVHATRSKGSARVGRDVVACCSPAPNCPSHLPLVVSLDVLTRVKATALAQVVAGRNFADMDIFGSAFLSSDYYVLVCLECVRSMCIARMYLHDAAGCKVGAYYHNVDVIFIRM